MSRIDILIEQARKRAEALRQHNQSQGATTSGNPGQVEYLIRAGLLCRCVACGDAMEPTLTYRYRGDTLCEDCYTTAQHADFQDTEQP